MNWKNLSFENVLKVALPLCAIGLTIGLLAECYFPIRIYLTGSVQNDVISQCQLVEATGYAGRNGYIPITVLEKSCLITKASFTTSTSDTLREMLGDTVHILQSEYLSRKIKVGSVKPTFLDVVFSSTASGHPLSIFAPIILFLFGCVIILTLVGFFLYRTETKIKKTTSEIQQNGENAYGLVWVISIYITKLGPYLTGLILLHVFVYFIIVAVLSVKHTSELLFGGISFLCLTIIFASPYIHDYMKNELLLKRKHFFRLLRAIISSTLSIYGIYKLLNFILSEEFRRYDELDQLFEAFLQTLV